MSSEFEFVLLQSVFFYPLSAESIYLFRYSGNFKTSNLTEVIIVKI